MRWRAGGEIQRAASRAASFLGANIKDATSLHFEPCGTPTSKIKRDAAAARPRTCSRTPTRPPPECVVAKQNEFEHFLQSMKKEAETRRPSRRQSRHVSTAQGSTSGMLELAHTDFLDKLGELAAKKQYVTAAMEWFEPQPALASKMGGLDVDEQKAVRRWLIRRRRGVRRSPRRSEKDRDLEAAGGGRGTRGRMVAAAPAAEALRAALNDAVLKLPDCEKVLARLEELSTIGTTRNPISLAKERQPTREGARRDVCSAARGSAF